MGSVYISADIPRAILMEKFVFVLYLSILPDIQVDTYSNYAAGDLSEWYNDIEVVGQISEAWKTIKSFLDYNNYQNQKNYFLKFILTNESSAPQEIDMYEYGQEVPNFNLHVLLTESPFLLNFVDDGSIMT